MALLEHKVLIGKSAKCQIDFIVDTFKKRFKNVEIIDYIPEDPDCDLFVYVSERMDPNSTMAIPEKRAFEKLNVKVVVVSDYWDACYLANTIDNKCIDNIYSFPFQNPTSVQSQVDELVATAERLLVPGKFGIQNFFFDKVLSIKRLSLDDFMKKEDIIQTAMDFSAEYTKLRRVQSAFITVADELIMNAMFAGDRETKLKILTNQCDISKIEVNPIKIDFCASDSKLGLSVTDKRGILHKSDLIKAIRQWNNESIEFREKTFVTGGMGFYLTLNLVTNFIVNITANKQTEVVALFDNSSAYKKHITKGKGFSISLVQL